MHTLLILFNTITAVLFGIATYYYSHLNNNKYPILSGLIGFLLPPVLISVLSGNKTILSGEGSTGILRIIFLRAIILLPTILIICIISNIYKSSSFLGALYAPTLRTFLGDTSMFIQGNIVEFESTKLVLLGSWAPFGAMISFAVLLGAFYKNNWFKYSCIFTILSFPLALISDWFRIINQTTYALGISNLSVKVGAFYAFPLSVYLLLFLSTYMAYRLHNKLLQVTA